MIENGHKIGLDQDGYSKLPLDTLGAKQNVGLQFELMADYNPTFGSPLWVA